MGALNTYPTRGVGGLHEPHGVHLPAPHQGFVLSYLALIVVVSIVCLVVEVVVKYIESIKSSKYFLWREVDEPSGLLKEPRPSRTIQRRLAVGMK